jgi:acyl-CoA thioester hydrolase
MTAKERTTSVVKPSGFAVTLELPVLWGDMDALRHVNNARYFTWFEAARIAYFDRIRGAFGGAGAGLGEVGPILATTTCDYRRPVTYPATVLVGVRVSEIGNSSVRMDYQVERSDAPGDACALGTSVVVVVRYATMEKVRVPDEMRAAIAALEARAGASVVGGVAAD